MRKLSAQLREAFLRKMREGAVPPEVRTDYLKWRGFYLDFCAKYRHPPRDEKSLEPFLQKLAEKQQVPERQAQAAATVTLYYALMATWSDAPEADGCAGSHL